MNTLGKSVLVLSAAALLMGSASVPVLAQDKVKIGFSQGTMESSWRVNMVERVKVVADGIGDYVREPAMRLTEDWIQRFPEGELDVIYAHNDGMALGAVAALEAAGRLDDVKVVGIDGEEAAYQAIKDGKMAATFTYHFVAPEGMMYAWDVAQGKTLDEKIVLPTAQIDATNVDQFLGTGF